MIFSENNFFIFGLIVIIALWSSGWMYVKYRRNKFGKIAYDMGLSATNKEDESQLGKMFYSRAHGYSGSYKGHQVEMYQGNFHPVPFVASKKLEGPGAFYLDVRVDGEQLDLVGYEAKILWGTLPNIFLFPDIKKAVDDYINK